MSTTTTRAYEIASQGAAGIIGTGWKRTKDAYRNYMAENGDSVFVRFLIGLVGAMGGIIITAFFMWVTFPKNLATRDDVSTLSTQMQKQIDEDHSMLQTARDKQETDEILLERLIEKLGLKSTGEGAQ